MLAWWSFMIFHTLIRLPVPHLSITQASQYFQEIPWISPSLHTFGITLHLNTHTPGQTLYSLYLYKFWCKMFSFANQWKTLCSIHQMLLLWCALSLHIKWGKSSQNVNFYNSKKQSQTWVLYCTVEIHTMICFWTSKQRVHTWMKIYVMITND